MVWGFLAVMLLETLLKKVETGEIQPENLIERLKTSNQNLSLELISLFKDGFDTGWEAFLTGDIATTIKVAINSTEGISDTQTEERGAARIKGMVAGIMMAMDKAPELMASGVYAQIFNSKF